MSFLRITPLTSVLGARVEGVSLADPSSDALVASIRAALDEHLVLVFSGQKLDMEQQHRFVSRLGRPEPHPVTRHLGGEETIVRIDNELIAPPDLREKPYLDHLAAHGAWHTDYTFHREIPTFATLRAEIVPPVGGDTLWASTISAWDALSKPVQGWLEGLRAIPRNHAEVEDSITRCRAGRRRRNPPELGTRSGPRVRSVPSIVQLSTPGP